MISFLDWLKTQLWRCDSVGGFAKRAVGSRWDWGSLPEWPAGIASLEGDCKTYEARVQFGFLVGKMNRAIRSYLYWWNHSAQRRKDAFRSKIVRRMDFNVIRAGNDRRQDRLEHELGIHPLWSYLELYATVEPPGFLVEPDVSWGREFTGFAPIGSYVSAVTLEIRPDLWARELERDHDNYTFDEIVNCLRRWGLTRLSESANLRKSGESL